VNGSDPQLDAIAEKIGLTRAERHLFLCPGPDCCSMEHGRETWEALKEKLATAGLPVLRSKAACFRICCHGPVLVVYPEGVWYREVTPQKLDRIIRQHLVGGKPVEEWVFARHPLTGG